MPAPCVIVHAQAVDPASGEIRTDLRGRMGVWFVGIPGPLVIPEGLFSLQTLRISNCPKLSSIPEYLGATLVDVSVSRCGITHLPNRMEKVCSVTCEGCEALEGLPAYTPRLEYLSVRACPRVQTIPDTLSELRSLTLAGDFGTKFDLGRRDLPNLGALNIFAPRLMWSIQDIPLMCELLWSNLPFGVSWAEVQAERDRRKVETFLVRIVHRMDQRGGRMQMDGVRMLKDFLY